MVLYDYDHPESCVDSLVGLRINSSCGAGNAQTRSRPRLSDSSYMYIVRRTMLKALTAMKSGSAIPERN